MNISEFLKQDSEKDILRFSTAGSVDDGKSTLIGRLLHDSKEIYEDQLASVKKSSGKVNNDVEIDFALLTDGLKAEREQGITIDVAYRYFSTPKRKFIIADTPGHEQYTRNMATGASTANLAVILIDARHGVLEQSKRHSFISSLLRIPHVVVAVNKMDLVDYSQEVFDNIVKDFSGFAAKLEFSDLHFIPMSALHGDNVVDKGSNMPWYKGAPLLEYLESVYIASDRNLVDFRMPVQYVQRPNLDFRGFSGQIASGTISKGDEILAVPSMKKSKVKSIVTFDGEPDYAFAPQAVTLTLEDEIDISRGDMLIRPHNVPHINRHFEAMLVWMDEARMNPNAQYVIKQASRYSNVLIDEVRYKVDVNTMHRQDTDYLNLNEIGRITLTSRQKLYFDPYSKNKDTGSFILIDKISNNTVAAGMILDREPEDKLPSNITSLTQKVENRSDISDEERYKRFKHKPVTIWLTGLLASGKNKIAYELERQLFDMGAASMVLDGHSIRAGMSRELDFSATDRAEHLRRVAEMSTIINRHGMISICAFVSPKADVRKQISDIIGNEKFLEIFVDAPLEFCAQNDKTGLYKKAEEGKLETLPGVTSPYDSPSNPALVIKPEETPVSDAVEKIIDLLKEKGLFL